MYPMLLNPPDLASKDPARAAAVRLAKFDREAACEMKFDIWRERLAASCQNTDVRPLLECSLGAALSLMAAERGNIQMLDDSGLIIKAQRGFSQTFLDYFRVVSHVNTSCGTAWKKRRLIYEPDITNSLLFHGEVLETLLAERIRAVNSVPLVTHSHRILGVLNVHYSRPHLPLDTDLARFQRLAKCVANLIEKLQKDDKLCGTELMSKINST
jgi:hypothetical protein